MTTVQLRVPPWIASMLDKQGSDWYVFDKDIKEGATIGDLLTEFASTHADFRQVIFDPDVGRVSDQVLVFVNDSLLQFPEMTEAELSEGDHIILLPVYAGG